MSTSFRKAVTQESPALHPTTDMPTAFTRTRRFILHWDNSRVPAWNRRENRSYDEKQQADGVLFGTGLVALDIGKGYESMGELEAVLALNGKYSITWIDY